MPYIANSEDAGDIGLQVFVCNEITLFINIQFRREKVIVRLITNKDKHAIDWQGGHFVGIFVAQLQLSNLIHTFDFINNSVIDDIHFFVRKGSGLSGFVGTQLVTAVDQRNMRAHFGQIQGFFNSGIAAADDGDRLILEEKAITGCTVGYAAAAEFPLIGNA